MRDLMLIASIAAVFATGWYFMGKLDTFLESNHQDQAALLSASENNLRIGFFDLLVADSLSGVLEKYSRIYPSVSVSLFSGTEAELMREFCLHKLDMIFCRKTLLFLKKFDVKSMKSLLSICPL